MLNRIRMDEEYASDTSSFVSSDTNLSVPTPELEKLDLNSGSSIPTAFGSSEELKSINSRPGTPSRNASSSSISQFFRRPKSSQGDSDKELKKKREGEDHLCRWLQGGNVIYKSVGMGLMDLTVGIKVIELAREKGVGTHVEGF